MLVKDFNEDPLALLDSLVKDNRVAIKRTRIPWDQDISLVDFYVDLKGNSKDDAYSKNKGKIMLNKLICKT